MIRALCASLLCLSFVGQAEAAVTEIWLIDNQTRDMLFARNFENPNREGHNATIPSKSQATHPQFNAWIPFADEQKHFDEGHYVRFEFKKTTPKGSEPVTIYVWQSKGAVRWSHELKHDPNAPAVPGTGNEGGKRKFTFRSDGTFLVEKLD